VGLFRTKAQVLIGGVGRHVFLPQPVADGIVAVAVLVEYIVGVVGPDFVDDAVVAVETGVAIILGAVGLSIAYSLKIGSCPSITSITMDFFQLAYGYE